MAKDKSLSKDERRAARKAAKESSLVEAAGVSKSSTKSKDKADKKEKKAKLAERLLKEANSSNVGGDGEVVSEQDSEAEEMDVEKTAKGAATRPVGALVPFANPLADEKVAKKVFRGVKKGEFLFLFFHGPVACMFACLRVFLPFFRGLCSVLRRFFFVSCDLEAMC